MEKKIKEMKKQTSAESYLKELFSIIRKAETISMADKKTRFNSTEIRLLGEVLNAKYTGKRMISTQLAKALGVTRSAISQMVNRLEEQGVVKRVADDVDRKIAYVELTDEALETYSDDLRVYVDFIGVVVEEFGEERFHTMCSLLDEFCSCVEEKKTAGLAKKEK